MNKLSRPHEVTIDKKLYINSQKMLNSNIDILRGLAILFIIVLHAWYFTPGYDSFVIIHYFVAKLHIGIQLFFVLSGYLIAKSWNAINTRNNKLTIFYLKRLFKIVPLYFIFLNLSICYFLFMRSVDSHYVPAIFSVNNNNLTIFNYITHIFFLQGFTPKWLNTLVDGGWSIVIEVYFYFLYPLVITKYCSTALNTLRCYIAGLILSMIAGGVLGYVLQLGDYSYRNFVVQIPCFFIGIFVFQFIKERAETCSPLESDGWIIYGKILCWILLFGMVKGNVEPLGAHHIYALIFGLFLYLMLVVRVSLSLTPIFVYLQLLGRNCYALFFLHLFLLKFFKDFVINHLLSIGFWPLLLVNIFCSLVLSLILSIYFFNKIDNYFVRLGSKIVDRIR